MTDAVRFAPGWSRDGFYIVDPVGDVFAVRCPCGLHAGKTAKGHAAKPIGNAARDRELAERLGVLLP